MKHLRTTDKAQACYCRNCGLFAFVNDPKAFSSFLESQSGIGHSIAVFDCGDNNFDNVITRIVRQFCSDNNIPMGNVIVEAYLYDSGASGEITFLDGSVISDEEINASLN